MSSAFAAARDERDKEFARCISRCDIEGSARCCLSAVLFAAQQPELTMSHTVLGVGNLGHSEISH
jgi:hypothetical protein